jgi:hypothetical protein
LYKLAILIDSLFNLPLKRQHCTNNAQDEKKFIHVANCNKTVYPPPPSGSGGIKKT